MSNNTFPSEFPNEFWTATSGDLSQKREHITTPNGTTPTKNAAKIVIDPTEKHQDWLGAGAAITDSAASLIWGAMDAEHRNQLLHELFDPKQGGYSAVRVPLGSCDFQSQKYYTYDDVPLGEHDAALENFSIGEWTPGTPDATKDLKYIVPVLQEILKINPAVKVIASPWSSPAWMKNTDHLTHGGHLRFGEFTGNGYTDKDRFEYIYAQTLLDTLKPMKNSVFQFMALPFKMSHQTLHIGQL